MKTDYLHDLAADGGFQCTIVVRQVWQLDLLGLDGQREAQPGQVRQSLLRSPGRRFPGSLWTDDGECARASFSAIN
jgi:hypothetical protein